MFIDEYGDTTDAVIVEVPTNDTVTGDNTLPTVSTDMQNSNDSAFSGFMNKLGSIGTTATQVGTAVGTAQRQINGAENNFKSARNAASSGNTPATFWLYATPVEKAMIILAVMAIVVTVSK